MRCSDCGLPRLPWDGEDLCDCPRCPDCGKVGCDHDCDEGYTLDYRAWDADEVVSLR